MRNGKLIDQFGNQQWFKDNKLHREDGPAVIWSDGGKEWFINGFRHREDGPAVISKDGFKRWWLVYECMTKEEWWEMLSDEWKVNALFNGEGV
jgi:hypothetical protein